MKKLLLGTLAVLLAFAPVSFASSSDIQEDGVRKGQAISLNFVAPLTASISRGVAAVSADFTGQTISGLTSLSSERVFATVMMYLPYYAPSARPASGATQGAIISKGGANAQDCGTNAGTTYVVCTSDGTNWVAL